MWKESQDCFCIQDELLSSRRQAIHVGGIGLRIGGFTDMQAALSNRATSHQAALNNDLIAERNGSVNFTTIINLPVECDESQFTTRDDQGNEAAC